MRCLRVDSAASGRFTCNQRAKSSLLQPEKSLWIGFLILQISGSVFCSLGKRFLADVGIMLTHGGALVPDKRHDNRIGDASVLKQGNGRVTQRVEREFASGALAGPTEPRESGAVRLASNPAATRMSAN